MFVFDSRVSEDSDQLAERTHGHRRPVRVYRARRDITRPPSFVYVDNSGRAVHDDAWPERIASGTGIGRHR